MVGSTSFFPHLNSSLLGSAQSSAQAPLHNWEGTNYRKHTEPLFTESAGVYQSLNAILLGGHDSIPRKIWQLPIFHHPQALLVSAKVFPSAAGRKKKWKQIGMPRVAYAQKATRVQRRKYLKKIYQSFCVITIMIPAILLIFCQSTASKLSQVSVLFAGACLQRVDNLVEGRRNDTDN